MAIRPTAEVHDADGLKEAEGPERESSAPDGRVSTICEGCGRL